MPSSDESVNVPATDASLVRAMLGNPAYLGAVTDEIRNSYRGKITQEGIAAHFGIGGKKPQARVSDWFRLNKPPPEVLQQPEQMLKPESGLSRSSFTISPVAGSWQQTMPTHLAMFGQLASSPNFPATGGRTGVQEGRHLASDSAALYRK